MNRTVLRADDAEQHPSQADEALRRVRAGGAR